MTTGTGKLYGNAILQALTSGIDWNSDTLKVMLCTSAYVPDQDAHVFKSDVTGEVVGTGYTAGGVALSSVAITYTASTNVIKLDAADVTWSTSTISAQYAVIYDSTPSTDATRPLIAYWDAGAMQSSSGADFKITWGAAGIATVTVS